ncbi:hypothetical protein TSOC_003152 [Tetrabaena socialis]|uniref:Uncharacterized protein n=1 Tax=Tetrabaena socialis TaxID=47790 RepID=A0A2J8AC78_9CHLO|nr:hypothetical protein TSOC_003152 [Tetrabaena socialis]|eukprot:PNH10134.1 hypothetical protein TSOC_003152 [Tetrabaena socialis]
MPRAVKTAAAAQVVVVAIRANACGMERRPGEPCAAGVPGAAFPGRLAWHWFCNSIPFSRVDGVCEPCWKCCLFPERFNFPALTNLNNDVVSGGCTQSCSCNLRKSCASNIDCAPGLFCGKPGPVSSTICMPAAEVARSTRDLGCPRGSYCPFPGEIIVCPAGFYCGKRAQFRTTCNYSDLLSTPEALVPVDGEADIVTRLKKDREPIRGNYCPEGSSKPSTVCAGGYYCPNASAQIICPEGYYCKPQSIYPVKCPL